MIILLPSARMYELPGNPLCPVASFRKYITKLNPKNPWLWQKPLDAFDEDDNVWYANSPLGKNTLRLLMKNISKMAHLSVEYTNHSIRATDITALDDAGFEARHIMRITGYKIESST